MLLQVTILDLKHNNLVTLPRSVFEMPALCELLLRHNCLIELPEVPFWPNTLMVLDVSHNSLSSLPACTKARRIRLINLSNNKLHSFPSCICSFFNLCTLILDDNPGIVSLPRELGELKKLHFLSLRNMNSLVSPPRAFHHETKSCLKYLRNIPEEDSQQMFTNLMIIGPTGKGKSTFADILMDTKCSKENLQRRVKVTSWNLFSSHFKLTFQFRIWDFKGDDTNLYTQRIFGFQNSLYAIVFNLNDGEAGIDELKPWFSTISQVAPNSKVIVVGTHLDEMPEESNKTTDAIFKQILDMVDGKIQILELIAVGHYDKPEFHKWLSTTICRCAKYLSNQSIGDSPSAYHKLNVEIKLLQQQAAKGSRSPLMHIEELKTLVLAITSKEVNDEEDLKELMEYLSNTGTLVHIPGKNSLMKNLFCLDFEWLSQIVSSLTDYREQSQCTRSTGIVCLENGHDFFEISKFPYLDWSENYSAFVESLVAGVCFNNKMVIPFLFPSEEPNIAKSVSPTDTSLCHRSISTKTGLPVGFWELLLCQIFKNISCIRQAMAKLVNQENVSDENDFSDVNSTCSAKKTDRNISSNCCAQSVESLQNQCLPPLPSSTAPLSTDCEHSKPSEKTSPSPITLHYWKTGLFYQNCSTFLCVKSHNFSEHGDESSILISSSSNDQGKELAVQVVDLVYFIIKKCYNSFLEDLKPDIFCCKDAKAGCKISYNQCLSNTAANISHVQCDHANAADSHSALLSDITPDVLLRDIDHMGVKYSDISIEDGEDSTVEEAKDSVILKGTLQNKPVTVRKYHTCNTSSFYDLRMELKELSRIRHPCIVNVVGTCISPLAIVVESRPLQSLSTIIEERTCLPHLTFFRIAAEVAAALRFLHKKGIILSRLTATNVMMWSLDPNSLLHCKLATHTTSAYFPELMEEPLRCQKGFSAPEVLKIGRSKHSLDFTPAADSFSYGALLTQVFTRQHLYQFTHSSKIDEKVINGSRPKLEGVVTYKAGYNYLSMLLRKCREHLPEDRPTMDDIISLVTSVKTQLLVGVFPVGSEQGPSTLVEFSLRDVKIPTSVTLQDELWLFYNEEKGPCIKILDSHMLSQVHTRRIKQIDEITSAVRHKNEIWVGSRCGSSSSQIDTYSAPHRSHMHMITIDELLTCMTAAGESMLVGTREGGVYVLTMNKNGMAAPSEVFRSKDCISSMVTTCRSIWIAHGFHIDFMNSTTFECEGSTGTEKGESPIGQLCHYLSDDLVWSFWVAQPVLTAWDAKTCKHKFNVNTCEMLAHIFDTADENSFTITAVTTAMDTVWVGMNTGHILALHQKQLLICLRPFTHSVGFLKTFPVLGVDKTERIRVLSYGTGEGLKDANYDDVGGPQAAKKNYFAIWDAYNSLSLRQLKVVEEHSPDLFDNPQKLKEVMKLGKFNTMANLAETNDIQESTRIAGPDVKADSPVDENDRTAPSSNAMCQITVRTHTKTLQIRIPKPPLLDTLRQEIEKAMLPVCSTWNITYKEMGERVVIDSQQEMDEYWAFLKRPTLQLKELDLQQ